MITALISLKLCLSYPENDGNINSNEFAYLLRTSDGANYFPGKEFWGDLEYFWNDFEIFFFHVPP